MQAAHNLPVFIFPIFRFNTHYLKRPQDLHLFTMSFSLSQLEHCLPPPDENSTWWIAFSGGLDSCVLLHALASLKLPVKLHALHINHQISLNAFDWQQHCALICAVLNVPFTAVAVTVSNTGRGIEDAAREARYQIFEQYVKKNDFLFTAHHADDQTETLLLRLMRGTGPRGLMAMAQSRPLGNGILYRPLLAFTRSDLEQYANSHPLSWVTDESNANDHYDRNYLRNQIMPLLKARWPGFAKKWQQTAQLCADTEELIDELAQQDLALADCNIELIGTSICLPYLKKLSPARRHNLLRFWLRTQGLNVPEQQHLLQIEQQIINGRSDAETQVDWGDVSLRIYQERLFALPRADIPIAPNQIIPLNGTESIQLPQGFCLTFEKSLYEHNKRLKANLPDLKIAFRQGGERCRPAGRAHSQTLKRLLQEYKVAPWLRECIPLVYSGDQLVAVADLWVCDGFQATGDGYCLKYQRNSKPFAG